MAPAILCAGSAEGLDVCCQAHRKLTKLILDMDSSVSETYGRPEGNAYDGCFARMCYHPLFLFNQFGDLERVTLRRGRHPAPSFGDEFCCQ